MPKSPADALLSMLANYEQATGKSFDTWVALMRKSKFAKHGEIMKCLKEQHGMSHGYANQVALRALQAADVVAAPGDLVAAQYQGAKAALRPLYDKLATAIATFGGDVDISPKKTYVSLRRSKQFALIQPTTAERLDVGINLKAVPPKGRLEAAGSFNAMVTHRVRVTSANDIDAELLRWLRAAYDAA